MLKRQMYGRAKIDLLNQRFAGGLKGEWYELVDVRAYLPSHSTGVIPL